MTALPADVHSLLTTLVKSLASSDNSVRAYAEKQLENEWSEKNSIELLLIFLAEQVCVAEDITLRSFSAVLFRRLAIKTPKEINDVKDRTIGTLSEASRQRIRSTLLEGFRSAQPNQVRHKIADAIAEVAKPDASPPGAWPELIPTMFQATTNDDVSFRESAFRVFSSIPELIDNSLIDDVSRVFGSGFDDSNVEVRVAACVAFVAFFRKIPKKNWPSLSPFLPSLLNSLPQFLQTGEESALTSVLVSLVDLVEVAPKMFKDMFPTIIEFCTAIAKNKELDSNTRMASLELLTNFAEFSPSMCKRTSSYADNMVIIVLSMLTEVGIDDDDASEWNNTDSTEEEDENPEHDAARISLDRIALKLNGQTLAAPLFQYLPAMISSSSWRDRQAALMALSSAAEGCADVLITEIPRILDMILATLDDVHPRVQYSCCNALGQMSTDFADVIQRIAGDRLLPALISKLTNKSVPRVQAHAAAALVNFSEAASKEVLEPYLDDLLSNLLGLLQSPKRYVQQQVVATIAIIADVAEKKFIKYYDTLMPLLIEVLRADMGDENRILKAKCIECSTLISLAVGKEKFSQHCQDLIQIFGHLQETATEDDDPVKSYLEEGWGRICRVIGKDFLPYLPAVLPPVIADAKTTQNLSLLEEDEAEEYYESDEWDVYNPSGKLVAVHTASLDMKVDALDLLRIYAVQLKGDFYPWVKEIVQDIGIPALDYFMHDGVRASAALTLAAMLKSAVAATGNTSQETYALWSEICNKLCEVTENEPLPELFIAYYTSLVECINTLAPNAISADQLSMLAKSINVTLTEVYGRIKERDNGDDEYTEDVEEEEEDTDEDLLDEINKVFSAIFKNSKSNFLQAFQILVPTIASLINDENSSLKLCGLCIVSDLLEHCGPQSAVLKEMFLNTIGDSLTASDAPTRQAAAYCVGMAAQHGGESYSDFCSACLEPMFKMASVSDSRAEENINATENLVSSIAKVCRSHSSSIQNLDVLIQQWIGLLPITQDREAASYAYAFLADIISTNHNAIISQTPKIVDSVIQALSHRVLTGTNAERVVTAIRQLLGYIPQPEAVALLQKYPSDLDVIQKWFS